MDNEILRISKLLTETYDGNNWTGINAIQALDGVTAEIAVKRINDLHLNIAELTAHLSCWNKVMTKRLQGENYEPEKEEDFPKFNMLLEEEWNLLKQNLQVSFDNLKIELDLKTEEILN